MAYYRAVMRADVAHGSGPADPGTGLQFDYLVEHGLKPADRMLEIGCGTLRAGWRFIHYLEPEHYYGIDISPDALLAAERTVTEYDLQTKLPHLAVVHDLTFDFLPSEHFDVIHAHGVFSHCPIDVIDECFAHVARVLKPGGRFDFTFDRTTATEHHVLWEDFYYRTETLTALASSHGLHPRFMEDWEELGQRQSKIRITR